MSSQKPTLDDLIREAREDRVPELDWSKMEEPLFARVEAEARSRAAVERYEGKRHTWVAGAMVLAVAASIPLFWVATRDATLDGAAQAHAPTAGDLSWKEPSAHVSVIRAGVAHDATAGESLALGDVVEPKSGRVVFVRADPGAVTWSVEDNTRVDVKATQGTLILALERGAVEAQVAPVANGEAFAIDVEGTRVAVHGTHLRVARDGLKATIDLREGVVSIGAPPRTGSTYGDLVTAPAHVEFDSSDPHGTLKVSHDLARVRGAAMMDPPAAPRAQEPREGRVGSLPVAPAVAQGPRGTAPVAAPQAPRVVAPPPVASPPAAPLPVAAIPVTPPLTVAPPPVASPALVAPVPGVPAPVRVDPNPQLTIANAVRTCENAHVAQASGVVVTVNSSLQLRVGASGMVEAARFDPPLAPDVQQCAVRVIYGTRFAAPGDVTVSVDFTR